MNAKFLDGAAIVHMLNPGTAKTFQDYVDMVFTPYISSQLDKTNRVDVIWDMYKPDSLKGTARDERGKGVRRHIFPTTAIPKNWKDFLRVDDNKTELLRFLSQQVTRITTKEGAAIYATLKGNVLCSVDNADLTNLVPCSHEEAATRLLLHVADAVKAGYREVCVRT